MASLINDLDIFFNNKNIIKINNRFLTFNSAATVQDKDQKLLSSIFGSIITDCNKIVNPQLTKNNKSILNPNSRLIFSDNKDENTKNFRELAQIIFKNIQPSSKNNKQFNEYWFLYASIYQLMFSSRINLDEISNSIYYTSSTLKKLYNLLSTDKANEIIIEQLLEGLCTDKTGEYDDYKMKIQLKEKCGRRLQINAPTNVSNKCASYIGTNLLKPCRQEAICERVISCDSATRIVEKNFQDILKKFRENIIIYYAYLGNQCKFTLDKINKSIEKKQETSNEYVESIQVPGIQLPSSFISIINKQDRELHPEYYQTQYGGQQNLKKLQKCYQQLSKITYKELKYITKIMGKKKLLKILNLHKDKNKKIINKVKHM